jgi:hypothetical protein
MATLNPNLTDFKAEYKLNKALQSLCNLIAGAQQPNGQPIFPNEPGTPLNDIIRQYNLQPAEAPPPMTLGWTTMLPSRQSKPSASRGTSTFLTSQTHTEIGSSMTKHMVQHRQLDRNRTIIRGESTPDPRQQRDLWNNQR